LFNIPLTSPTISLETLLFLRILNDFATKYPAPIAASAGLLFGLGLLFFLIKFRQ
jgi:hypothetical protein